MVWALTLLITCVTVLLEFGHASRTVPAAFLTPNSRASSRTNLLAPSYDCNHETIRIQESGGVGRVSIRRFLSDWSSFQALDDDDDILDLNVDKTDYAREEDSQDLKAEVGSSLKAPTIERPAEAIEVPAGAQLELTEENVLGLLEACRYELGTLFGYSAENRGVGITGGVEYVDLDGPTVIIKLKGRFWHTRPAILQRVGNYLQQRIPEIVDVIIEDPWQLTDEANEAWTLSLEPGASRCKCSRIYIPEKRTMRCCVECIRVCILIYNYSHLFFLCGRRYIPPESVLVFLFRNPICIDAANGDAP